MTIYKLEHTKDKITLTLETGDPKDILVVKDQFLQLIADSFPTEEIDLPEIEINNEVFNDMRKEYTDFYKKYPCPDCTFNPSCSSRKGKDCPLCKYPCDACKFKYGK